MSLSLSGSPTRGHVADLYLSPPANAAMDLLVQWEVRRSDVSCVMTHVMLWAEIFQSRWAIHLLPPSPAPVTGNPPDRRPQWPRCTNEESDGLLPAG